MEWPGAALNNGEHLQMNMSLTRSLFHRARTHIYVLYVRGADRQEKQEVLDQRPNLLQSHKGRVFSRQEHGTPVRRQLLDRPGVRGGYLHAVTVVVQHGQRRVAEEDGLGAGHPPPRGDYRGGRAVLEGASALKCSASNTAIVPLIAPLRDT